MNINLKVIYIYICLGVLLSAGVIYSQPDTLWTGMYGGSDSEQAFSVTATPDGGCAVIGHTYSFLSGKSDIWIVRLDATGDTLWTKLFGGSLNDEGLHIAMIPEGNFIFTGYTVTADSGEQLLLVKIDSLGNVLWQKNYGGTGNERGNCAIPTSDGGYIVAGVTSPGTSSDMWILKTNALGDTVWTRIIGGGNPDEAKYICTTHDGGYVVTGYTYSYGSGFSDIYLVKLNDQGVVVWSTTVGDSGYEYSVSVLETDDYGFFITGQTTSYGAGSYDIWVVRTDSLGNVLWTKTFGGPNTDFPGEGIKTSDGNYLISGTLYSDDAWLFKLDDNGDTLWTMNVLQWTTDVFRSVVEATDGEYIAAGYIYNNASSSDDFYVIKTEPEVGIGEETTSGTTRKIVSYFPSIVRGKAVLKTNLNQDVNVIMQIFDVKGTLISSRNVRIVAGEQRLLMDFSDFESGVYFLVLKADSCIESLKFMVLK